MKKIIRLTESDLTRIVRRVISEQQAPEVKSVVDTIKQGVTKKDRHAIAKGVYMVKKNNYNAVLAEIKKLGKFTTIMEYINSVWKIIAQQSNLFGYADDANKWILDLERHLRQFNDDERGMSWRFGGALD